MVLYFVFISILVIIAGANVWMYYIDKNKKREYEE